MYFFISSSEGFSATKVIDKSFNSFCSDKCLKEILEGKLQCKCGEDIPLFDWIWNNENSSNVKMSDDGKEVLFHPVYSSGTAAVRGVIPFQQNYHYYWEIKMISKLYGTDVMIGVGTSKIRIPEWKFKFCSLLGIDSESWGFSYHGNIQHNKLRRKYGTRFGLGSIIGIHLDMCNGTMEYFLNRKPLGIAFEGLKGKELYPMVCSTAAQSAIRITCCISKESTLQMRCLLKIMENPNLCEQYRNIPGLTRFYDKQYFWIQPQPITESDEKKRLAELDEDVALSMVDGSYLRKNKKFKSVRLISLLYDEEIEDTGSDTNEIYNFDDESSTGSNAFTGEDSESELANVSEGETEPDAPSTSESTYKESLVTVENRNSFKVSCATCKSQSLPCNDCTLHKQLQEDSSSDSSGLTFII